MALIKCNECGNEVSNKALACPSCGAPISVETPDQQLVTQDPPHQNKPVKKKTGCRNILLIFILLFGGALVFGISQMAANPEKYQKTVGDSKLAKVTQMNPEQEERALELLLECGIEKINTIEEFQSGDTRTSYHAGGSNVDYRIVLWITDELKEIDAIYYGDYTIYENGELVNNIMEFQMTSEEKATYELMIKKIIEDSLVSPSTAKYAKHSEWKYHKNFESYIIESYLDSQNAFGATVRTDFQFTFKNRTPVSIIINGEEQMK